MLGYPTQHNHHFVHRLKLVTTYGNISFCSVIKRDSLLQAKMCKKRGDDTPAKEIDFFRWPRAKRMRTPQPLEKKVLATRISSK